MSWLPPVLPERVDVDDLVFVPLTPEPLTDAVVRGWLHERPAVDLIRASLTWLGRAPFDFSRIWWQANSDVPDQLLGCDRLGLSTVIRIGQTPIWELRS